MFTITKKEKLPDSQFVIEGDLSVEVIDAKRKKALEKFQQIFAIDGFRKGHIPEKILVEKVGELAIAEEAASLALEDNYEAIIKEVNVSTIGQPKVTIVKIAPGQPMTFKIETAVVPEITLPDYKKLAKVVMKNEEVVTVEDVEVGEAIKEIQNSVAHHKFHETHGETEDHNHDIKEEDLPAVTDEWVKTLGQFENVEDFKSKLKTNLMEEKTLKGREKKRLETIESIIKETKVEIPQILIESELEKMIGQFKDNIASMGLSYDEYLTKISKSEEDMRNEWKGEAKKRAAIQLILNKIAVTEKLTIEEVEVKAEAEKLMTYYKEADPLRIHIYVETMMLNEKVWKFLEDQK